MAILCPVILGLEGNTGGFGWFRGAPHSNVNLGVRKSIGLTERFHAEVSCNFMNALHRNEFLNSTLNIASQHNRAVTVTAKSAAGSG